MAQVKSMLEKNKVTLYFCSHSSQYLKRTDSTIDYVVAGAGSSSTVESVLQESSLMFGLHLQCQTEYDN